MEALNTGRILAICHRRISQKRSVHCEIRNAFESMHDWCVFAICLSYSSYRDKFSGSSFPHRTGRMGGELGIAKSRGVLVAKEQCPRAFPRRRWPIPKKFSPQLELEALRLSSALRTALSVSVLVVMFLPKKC